MSEGSLARVYPTGHLQEAVRGNQHLVYSFIFILDWNISVWAQEYVQVVTLRFNKRILGLVDVCPVLAGHSRLTEG